MVITSIAACLCFFVIAFLGFLVRYYVSVLFVLTTHCVKKLNGIIVNRSTSRSVMHTFRSECQWAIRWKEKRLEWPLSYTTGSFVSNSYQKLDLKLYDFGSIRPKGLQDAKSNFSRNLTIWVSYWNALKHDSMTAAISDSIILKLWIDKK